MTASSADDLHPEGAQIEDEKRIAAAAGEIAPQQATSGDAFAHAIKEALLASVVALGMFGLLIGIETKQNVNNELIYETRWWLLFIVIAVVGVGRFLISLFVHPHFKKDGQSALGGIFRRKEKPILRTGSSRYLAFKQYFVPIAIGFMFLYPPIVLGLVGTQGSIKWVDSFGIQILIYVMLGWGLNIVVGLAGLLDLGYVAFYAVGAYGYTLLATEYGLSFWILLPLAGIFAATWGIILGFPVLRLRGDYLAIVTLAFGEIIRLVLINWREVTNGGFGIISIPKVTMFGIPFDSSPEGFAATFGLPLSSAYYKIFLYYVILVLALITAFATTRLRKLPIGRAWESLREDEIACRSLGINTVNTKLTAFAIGAMFAGFAGSFFATRQGFINPESFTFLESAFVVAIVVLGGMGSMVGVAVAAAAMIGSVELLRELTVLKAVFGPTFEPARYRLLLFGLVMVIIMIWRPRGFASTRRPTIFLFQRKDISGAMVGEGR